MRIKLDDRRKKARRRDRRRGRRSGSRTFETAVTQPWVRPGRRSRAGDSSAGRDRREASSRSSRTEEAQPTAEGGTLVAAPRFSAPRLRSVRSRLWSSLILICLIGAIAYVSAHDKFFVSRVQVVGARHVDPALVLEIADVHRQNIFWVKPRLVAGQIAQLQGIKAVRVQCKLPASVTIEVTEREPAALWHLASLGQEWWVDEEGIVLPYAGDPETAGIIFVVDSTERELQTGARIEPTGLVLSAQRLAAVLPEARVFYYDQVRGLSFLQNSAGGEWPVYVGTSDDLQRKIRVVEALTEYFAANSIQPTYVDVRTASHPLYGEPPGKGKKKGD